MVRHVGFFYCLPHSPARLRARLRLSYCRIAVYPRSFSFFIFDTQHMTSPLDQDSVAQYLLDSPHFFEEHAELLGKIRLSSPLLGRAVSLQERQMEILREKIKVQDLRLADMVRLKRLAIQITVIHHRHRWNRVDHESTKDGTTKKQESDK